MTVNDKKPGWIAKNRNVLFLMVCAILCQVFFYFTTTAKRISGRVDKVLSYSNGVQKVRLSTGETQALALTGYGHYYIQVGDSVVQEAGSENATIYRPFPTYTQVSVFGPGPADFPGAAEYTGLIKRYQIKKP